MSQFPLALWPQKVHLPGPGSAVARLGPSTSRVSLSAVPTEPGQSFSYVTAIGTHHSLQVAWKAMYQEEIKKKTTKTQSLNSAPFPPCE